MKVNSRTVVLGDGDFPTSAVALKVLEESDNVICCDASILKLLRYYAAVREINSANVAFHANNAANVVSGDNVESVEEFAVTEIERINGKCIRIIGDMDTLSLKYRKRFVNYIIEDCDQETNDLTKAFKYALSFAPSSIAFLGICGGREDHTLGNISLLADYKELIYSGFSGVSNKTDIYAVTNYGVFYPVLESCEFATEPGSQVSIFSFDNTLNINAQGLLYPTNNVIFDMWWKATLNEAVNGSFALKFNHPAKVLIYIAPPKQ
jgi:thiamine pyrophosphokinase